MNDVVGRWRDPYRCQQCTTPVTAGQHLSLLSAQLSLRAPLKMNGMR
jgi:hypothetical protein